MSTASLTSHSQSRSRSITEYFSKLKDPRRAHRRKHLLQDIIVIALCAVIAGAQDWQEVALFGAFQSRRLESTPDAWPDPGCAARRRSLCSHLGAGCGSRDIGRSCARGPCYLTSRSSSASDWERGLFWLSLMWLGPAKVRAVPGKEYQRHARIDPFPKVLYQAGSFSCAGLTLSQCASG